MVFKGRHICTIYRGDIPAAGWVGASLRPVPDEVLASIYPASIPGWYSSGANDTSLVSFETAPRDCDMMCRVSRVYRVIA